jgi:hypothetical protein
MLDLLNFKHYITSSLILDLRFNMFTFLTEEQNAIIVEKTRAFKGQLPTLSAALGAVVLGHEYGWRVLKIVHSPATLKKYEAVIGLKYDDICPETTDISHRNVGFRFYQKIGAFWKVVLGQVKVDSKNEADDGNE